MSTTSHGDLYFKAKIPLVIRCLLLPCQTLASDGSNTCVCHDRDLCLSAWTLASVATKDCSCQNRVREASLKGSLLFCLTAMNRCIQEISARQEAAPRLQQKEPPVPNSGNNVKVRRLSSFPFVRIRKLCHTSPRYMQEKQKSYGKTIRLGLILLLLWHETNNP